MTCTCEKCNQKRVIDCLFVKVVNLHIARQTRGYLSFELGTELGTELRTGLGTNISIRDIQLFQLTLSDQSKKLQDKTARLCGLCGIKINYAKVKIYDGEPFG